MIESNVKKIMSEKKMTYASMERATGLSSHTITRARSLRICELSLEKLGVIALALGVKIKDLFEEKD